VSAGNDNRCGHIANVSAELPPPPFRPEHNTDPARVPHCTDSLRTAHTDVDLQVVGLESLQRESTADQWYGRREGGDINDRVRSLYRQQPALLLDTTFCGS